METLVRGISKWKMVKKTKQHLNMFSVRNLDMDGDLVGHYAVPNVFWLSDYLNEVSVVSFFVRSLQ
jgi:hypothetical protein